MWWWQIKVAASCKYPEMSWEQHNPISASQSKKFQRTQTRTQTHILTHTQDTLVPYVQDHTTGLSGCQGVSGPTLTTSANRLPFCPLLLPASLFKTSLSRCNWPKLEQVVIHFQRMFCESKKTSPFITYTHHSPLESFLKLSAQWVIIRIRTDTRVINCDFSRETNIEEDQHRQLAVPVCT